MEKLNKYLVTGYVVTIFFIGILFYLSNINSKYILSVLIIFLLVSSILFFYGINLFKPKNDNFSLKEEEKIDDSEKEFFTEFTHFSSEISKNIVKDKIKVKSKKLKC